MRLVHVLGNPASRGGTGDVEWAADAISESGHIVSVLEATSATASRDAARRAAEEGAERLVVVGGDGLVRIAVDALAESETALGIIPQGTGNDFARALGLLQGSRDVHLRRALAPPVPVDAMRTNHGWVASVATIGFSGDVTERANRLRWPRGQQRYTLATLLQLPRLRRLDLTVEVDGVRHDASTSMLSVGNTAYFGGGMRICPDVWPDDGQLETVVIGPVGRLTFIRVFPSVFGGRHVEHPAVTTHLGRKVVVSGSAGQMWADGDPLGPLPVTCEVVQGAIQVAGAHTR